MDRETSESGMDEVEIRHNASLSALVGVPASALAIAYLWRASQTGSIIDWGLYLLMFLVGVVTLAVVVDARTPLLVADSQGVRIRLGREWRGLPWGALDQVVVEDRDSFLHDGRLVLSPRNLSSALEGLESGARRQVAWLQRLYGAPLAVPLGLTTRSSTQDILEDLTELAAGRTEVVLLGGRERATLDAPTTERSLETPEVPEPLDDEQMLIGDPRNDVDPDEPHPHGHVPHTRRSRVVGGLGTLVSRVGRGQSHDVDATEPTPSLAPALARFDPVEPLRELRRALRTETSRDTRSTIGNAALQLEQDVDEVHIVLPEQSELLRGAQTIEATLTGNVRPIAKVGDSIEPLVIDGFVTEPAFDPVIGPEIAAARTRVRLTIDELSDRTRIRPHVLESIEVDDFAPCGGDFYARGHLRTLARVLGLDAVEMLREFDARYAHAPINARRVFEAELATGINGGMRSTVGGPKWSLLVGAVLCLLMVWGVARLFADTPEELASPSSMISDSAGLAANQEPITSPLMTTRKMTVTATTGASKVVVRDRTGRVLWTGRLAQGEHQQVAGLPPFSVTATNAGAVGVKVMGKGLGLVGAPGKSGTKTFG